MRSNGQGAEGVKGAGEGRSSSAGDRPTLFVSANAFWNIANFRTGLIAALAAEGYRIIVAAPDPDIKWGETWVAEMVDISVDRSGLNPARDVMLLAEYARLLGRYRADAFIGFTAKPNIYGAIAAALRGIPALPNVSGLGTAFINRGLLSALVGSLYRIAFRKCPTVFFQNGDDCELFIKRKIVRREQALLLPGSGIDLRHFSPAPPPTDICFLFIGRLLGDKGVREFVDAAKLVRANNPDWRFQLLGPLDEENRSAISRDELDNWLADGHVEYLGQSDDVRPYIAAATAVVLPSYREGMPRSLLEAAAMARPLIATDVPGNRHIVSNDDNGFLCAVRDASSLAMAMVRMATMARVERLAMGERGRKLVEREFAEARVIRAYVETLSRLCSRRRS